MKLFFASDLHGDLAATERMLAQYQRLGCDGLILLGDMLNHGPRNPIPEHYQPTAVAEALNQYASEIIAVRGNCDSEVDQMLLQFPMMADYAWVMLPSGQRLFLTHGHLYNAEKRPPLRDGDVIVHGHTHVPVAERNQQQFIFNPGSVTFPRNGLPPSYGLYHQGRLEVRSFDEQIMVHTPL